jgi:hypothetical protein
VSRIPEIKAHCAAEKRLALAAKQFTTLRLVGRTVLLEDVREDKYPKRVDAYVTMPDGRHLACPQSIQERKPVQVGAMAQIDPKLPSGSFDQRLVFDSLVIVSN